MYQDKININSWKCCNLTEFNTSDNNDNQNDLTKGCDDTLLYNNNDPKNLKNIRSNKWYCKYNDGTDISQNNQYNNEENKTNLNTSTNTLSKLSKSSSVTNRSSTF